MDSRDLVEADLMNLLGRHVGRRHHPHAVLVPLLAVGQGIETYRLAGRREVFVAQEVVDSCVGRKNRIGDHLRVGDGQALAILVTEGIRHVRDRFVERALGNVVDELGLELRHDLFHQDARLHDPLPHSLSHVLDHLVDAGDSLVGATQEILVVLDRIERVDAGAAAELHEEVHHVVELVERLQVAGKLLAFERLLPRDAEDVVAEPVLVVELLDIDREQALEKLAVQRFLRGAILGAEEVREAVVVAGVADGRRPDRVHLEASLEVLVKQFLQEGAGIGCGAAGRRLTLAAAGGQQSGRGDHRCDSEVHSRPPDKKEGQCTGSQAMKPRSRRVKFARFGATTPRSASAMPNHRASVAAYWSADVDGIMRPPPTSSGPPISSSGKLP